MTLDEFLGDVTIPQLSDERKQMYKSLLTENECYTALKGMQGNELPGCVIWVLSIFSGKILIQMNEMNEEGQFSSKRDEEWFYCSVLKKGIESDLNNIGER